MESSLDEESPEKPEPSIKHIEVKEISKLAEVVEPQTSVQKPQFGKLNSQEE